MIPLPRASDTLSRASCDRNDGCLVPLDRGPELSSMLAEPNGSFLCGLPAPECCSEANLPVGVALEHQTDVASHALQMRRVSKAFGKVDVLRNVDFSLRTGEIHALMGENGAGKSTLMKIVGGIYDDYLGDIEVFGRSVRFAGPRDASRA